MDFRRRATFGEMVKEELSCLLDWGFVANELLENLMFAYGIMCYGPFIAFLAVSNYLYGLFGKAPQNYIRSKRKIEQEILVDWIREGF